MKNENASIYFVDNHKANDKTAFIEYSDKKRTLSYSSLYNQSSKINDLLIKNNIQREDRVALLMLDVIEFPIIFWGCLKSNVVPVPINTLLSKDIVKSILDDSRAKAIFISSELLVSLKEILTNNQVLKKVFVVGESDNDFLSFENELVKSNFSETIHVIKDEVAFWLYSSGSTGKPKGVKHVHGSLQITYDTYAKQVLGIQQNDIVFSVAKLFFAYGLGNAMSFPMSVGATTVLLPTRPTPQIVNEILIENKITIFYAVPTIFAALIEYLKGNWHEENYKLRLSVSAGEALPKKIGEEWKALTNTEILDGIGSTEMLHIFISNHPNDIEYGTTGKAVPGYELKLVDENNKLVKEDEIGELLVNGASSAEGYWNLRDKTRKTFEGEWTRTGDKYIRQKNGNYVYCGRTDDMFKVSGIWVSPFEVEQAVASHPKILEAAVVPEIDKEGLVKSKAFVILKEELPEKQNLEVLKDEIKEYVKEKIGLWKYPRNIVVVKDLPKTATGKMQRFKLR